MALAPVQISPGIYTLETDRGAKNRWKSCDKVRFRDGLPQKIGGWNREGLNTFIGKCRGILPFVSLTDIRYIGLGTHVKLYVWNGGTYFDVTPIRSSGTLALNPFSTTNASAVVTVTHTSHAATNGDYATYTGAAAVGGITINGEYQLTVVNANSYTITHSAAATSTATGGGAAVTFAYQIPVGNQDSTAGLGYGVGGFGLSTYGTPRTTSDILYSARTWSLAKWGEDMIGNPVRGGIYVWDTSLGTSTRATVITNAPISAQFVLVHPSARILIALGAHNGTADDPLNVAWCTEENYTVWTETTTNSAGSQRLLDSGTEIITGIVTNTEIVIITDSAIIAMTFIGAPDVFGFTPRGKGITIAGPSAAIEAGGRVYWMGKTDFYVYDGRVQDLPCDVRNYVFDDINLVQSDKFHCGLNVEFNEIIWFYCSAAATEIDRYVIYNHIERIWMTGTLSRTSFNGDKSVFSNPLATGADGYIYLHESGTDNDAAAITATLESYDMDIGEGEDVMYLSMMVPDFKVLTGSVDMSFKGRKYPQGSQTNKGPYTITSSTEFINPNMRTRQAAIKVESDAMGDHWRMGTMRIDVKPDGKR